MFLVFWQQNDASGDIGVTGRAAGHLVSDASPAGHTPSPACEAPVRLLPRGLWRLFPCRLLGVPTVLPPAATLGAAGSRGAHGAVRRGFSSISPVAGGAASSVL